METGFASVDCFSFDSYSTFSAELGGRYETKHTTGQKNHGWATKQNKKKERYVFAASRRYKDIV